MRATMNPFVLSSEGEAQAASVRARLSCLNHLYRDDQNLCLMADYTDFDVLSLLHTLFARIVRKFEINIVHRSRHIHSRRFKDFVSIKII